MIKLNKLVSRGIMETNIKKCFRYLDLPFDATKEDIELRQKIMIKMVKSKSVKDNRNYDDKIEKINFSALTLLDFIDKNGKQEPEKFSFRPSMEDLYGELFTLLIVVIFCVTSFLIML